MRAVITPGVSTGVTVTATVAVAVRLVVGAVRTITSTGVTWQQLCDDACHFPRRLRIQHLHQVEVQVQLRDQASVQAHQ